MEISRRRLLARAASGAVLGTVPDMKRDAALCREAALGCLDRLLEYGLDRYGPLHTPRIMSVVDTRTDTAPHSPELLEAMVRTEGRPGRRNPGGCDLWDDMPMLRALHAASRVTGDKRYSRAADASMRCHLEQPFTERGLLPWGSHLYVDAYTDTIADDRHGAFHEILIHLPLWGRLWALNPAATRREIEGIWQWHICDKATGQHNRHDDGQPGCDFAFSGGSFVLAFASLYQKTRKRDWLDRARLVAQWHWKHRNPETNLTVDAPSTGERHDAHHFFTTLTGPHCSQLLRSWELSREPFFREAALAYLRAYLRYGWDNAVQRFHAALRTDGTPVGDQPKGEGYDAWFPTGAIDIWPTTMYSYEFALVTAQTYLYAWELTRDREMLEGARRWAQNIQAELPPDIGRRWRKEAYALLGDNPPRGAYAEGYGRAISFFVGLHRATDEAEHLALARSLAVEAINRLSHRGWLRGHPAKPTLEATDGVGFLVYALLELAALPRRLPPNL